jgi:hypothetical protein
VRCQPIVLMQLVTIFSSPSSFSFSLSFIPRYYVLFVSHLCTQYFYHGVSLVYDFYPLLLFCFCIFLFTPIYSTDFYVHYLFFVLVFWSPSSVTSCPSFTPQFIPGVCWLCT